MPLPFDAGNGDTPGPPLPQFCGPGASSAQPLYVLNLDPALVPVLEEDPDNRPYWWDLPEWETDECL